MDFLFSAVAQAAFVEIASVEPVLLGRVFVVLEFEVELVLVLKALEALMLFVAGPKMNHKKSKKNECPIHSNPPLDGDANATYIFLSVCC